MTYLFIQFDFLRETVRKGIEYGKMYNEVEENVPHWHSRATKLVCTKIYMDIPRFD